MGCGNSLRQAMKGIEWSCRLWSRELSYFHGSSHTLRAGGFSGRKAPVPASKFHVFQTSFGPFILQETSFIPVSHDLGFGCILYPRISSYILSWNLWNLFVPEGNVLGLGEVLYTLSLFFIYLF